MKFYIGDKVRILDGSGIENYTDTWCMEDAVGKIFTIESMKKFPDGRIGFNMEEDIYTYDKRGLELVKRGPNAPKRKRKAKKPTLKYKVGDKVRVRKDIEPGFRSKRGFPLLWGEMADARGKEYTVRGITKAENYELTNGYIYCEEMLEPVTETTDPKTTEKPTRLVIG